MNINRPTFTDKIIRKLAAGGSTVPDKWTTPSGTGKMNIEKNDIPGIPKPLIPDKKAPFAKTQQQLPNMPTMPKMAEAKDDPEHLTKIATHYRAMQLLAHNSHNLVSGRTFFEDHEFFGGLYGDYEGSYDRVVELLIGNGDTPDLVKMQSSAADKLSSMTKDGHFNAVLSAEKDLQGLIEDFASSEPSQAALNMVGDLAEASKVRIYKIRQRIAN